jgi:hypothetical protein
VVLDCFNGSGTSGIAALLLGRSYIGIELNPEYITLAKRRLADALKQRKERSLLFLTKIGQLKPLVAPSVVDGVVALGLTSMYNSGMTTLETFQAFEETKAAVAKLQGDLDAALTKQEELKAVLRSELGIEAAPAPTSRRRASAGAPLKRAPRSLESIIMTACGRKLKEAQAAGTKKAAALADAILQAEGIAKDRGGFTEELKAALVKRAEEIFGKK